MRPCFEGLEEHVPLFVRESFVELIDDGTISVEQITLPDAEIHDPEIKSEVDWRWNEGSPLRHAAYAVIGYLASRRVDVQAIHLHGKDLDKKQTPYYAGFQLRYIRALPWCFTEYHGVEWIEIPNPTRSKPILALRIQLLNRDKMAEYNMGVRSLFT